MAVGLSKIWTHCNVNYEVTWGETLAFAQMQRRVHTDARMHLHERSFASVQIGSVHAIDAKELGETT